MIKGWDGPTRVVEGGGECPKLCNMIGETLYVTKITKRYIHGTLTGDGDSITALFGRFDGWQKSNRTCQINDAVLAALNALAAEHGGTWTATPEGTGENDAAGA